MLNKAHVIQLNPTKKQKGLLHQSFGVARHSFNWGLDMWNKQYKEGAKPSAMSLIKLQNSIKKEQMPFYLEVSKNAPQYAIWNVEAAWKKYFENNKVGNVDKLKNEYIAKCKKNGLEVNQAKLNSIGKPNFKKKGKKDSYVAVENKEQFKQKAKKIWLPRIGWVKCEEDLRFTGKVNNVVVKRIADKYFAVVNMITNEAPMVRENQGTVGVDFGISTLATCSNGKVFENPKALKANLDSLKRMQRHLSRKVKGSSNSKKLTVKLAKRHYRISNVRKTALHNVTSYLAKNFSLIKIEDLNVSGMLKNRKLSRSISDVGFYELRRQLEYKTIWYGSQLQVVDRWYPSSKLCSNCGNKKEQLKLSERTYNCDCCGYSENRDLNAAKNLASYSPTHELCGSNAFGDASVGGVCEKGNNHIVILF